jgi:hypothetical protein
VKPTFTAVAKQAVTFHHAIHRRALGQSETDDIISTRAQKFVGDAAATVTVSLSFVEVCEVDPPAGVPPIHWRLLTTHEVSTLADALRMTRYYRERWTIEQLFRVMQTKGFDIEAARIEDATPFENLATATLIAAIQVLQMVRDRDGLAARPLHDFDPADQPALQAICATLQGKTERQKNPACAGLARLRRLDLRPPRRDPS